MKNLKYISLVIISLLSFFVTGCLNIEQEVSMDPDGGGKMKLHYWVKANSQDSLQGVYKSNLFKQDTLAAIFASTKYKITKTIVWSDTSDTTRHGIIELSFKHLDSLNNSPLFPTNMFKLEEGAEGQRIFEQKVAFIPGGKGLLKSNYKLSYSYYFPGKIITYNAQKYDKKTLYWNYNSDDIKDGKTLSVTYEPYKIKETPYWIYAMMLFTLLLVTFFLFRKKRD